MHASSSSAAKIYNDMDILEKNISRKVSSDAFYFLPYLYLYSTLIKTFVTYSFQWEVSKLHQHQPQLLQLTPIEAAGKLYKVHEISQMPSSAFEVTTTTQILM
jgi:hypothetical protein